MKCRLIIFLAVISHSLLANECVRAEPVPKFSSSTGVTDYSFVHKSPHVATEHFTLPSGAAVTIEHGGCEDYVLTISFSLASNARSPKETKFWLQKSLPIVMELDSLNHAPNTTAIISAINKAQLIEHYEYGKEIETIKGYEYTTFEATPVNDGEVKLMLTYVILL